MMNTIQEGGKLISEGGYGCVYYPHLDCSLKESTTNKDEYISKVQRYNDAAKNEINIGNIVKTIKNYKNFFAPIIDSSISTCNDCSRNVMNSTLSTEDIPKSFPSFAEGEIFLDVNRKRIEYNFVG